MPYIEVRTSKSIENPKLIQMKDFLGKNISIIPEKEESKLMVEFVTDANIFYGGSNESPSVKISVIFSEEQEENTWRKKMARPKIKITIIDRLGKQGCHRGHRVGESFDFDTERGNLCPMAMHIAFPYIDILRYGGNIPGQPEGTAVFCCSDVDTINVFKIEVVKEEV